MEDRPNPLLGLMGVAALVGAAVLLSKLGKKPVRPRSLAELKKAILGSTRGAVASIFGPPPAATAKGPGAQVKDYWHAATWYYPLDAKSHTAVAITFAGDRAEAVEFIAGPEQNDEH